MKISTLLFIFILLKFSEVYGQTKIIQGKIIDEKLVTIPDIKIQNSKSVILVKTDLDGKFKVEIPLETSELIISGLGFERPTIKIPTKCDDIEFIIMSDNIYDYISLRKIDRLRKKRFKRLSDIHQLAFDKGIFLSKDACFEQDFISIEH